MICVQVVRFSCLNQAHDDCTCIGTSNCVMKQKVFPGCCVGLCPSFRCVVGDFASSIQKIVHQRFFVVKSIVYCFFPVCFPPLGSQSPAMTRTPPRSRAPFPGVSASVPLQEVLCNRVPGKTDGCRKQLLFRPEEGSCHLTFRWKVLPSSALN